MFYKKITVAFLVLALSACSYLYGEKGVIKNRDSDYLQATSIPSMQVPPGLSSNTIEAHYPVSDTVYSEASKKPSLVPPGL